LKAAALAIAALAATPYALSYDYCILSMAVAFLVKDGLARGFLRGERTIFIVSWIGFSLFAFMGAIFLVALMRDAGFGESLLYFFLAGVPLIICALLFAVTVRRAILIQPDTIETASRLRPQTGNPL